MISWKEVAACWVAAILYTAYVVGAVLLLSPLGVGGVIGSFVASLVPLMAFTFWGFTR